jgi:hypothetical protein
MSQQKIEDGLKKNKKIKTTSKQQKIWQTFPGIGSAL